MVRHLLRNEPLGVPLLLCLAAGFACVFTFNLADPDLWGHVRYGEHMLEQRRIFDTDPYSYLSNGFPWINHELLCEFTLGYLEPRAGATGLLVWKLLMGCLTLLPLWWSHRKGEFESLTVVLIAALLALNLWPGWTVRPQLFTYLFLSILAWALTEHARGRPFVLWLVPPLVVAWTNAHGGFVAGLAIFGLYLSYRGGELLWTCAPGWPRRLAGLGAVLAASLAATLVNPYGVELVTWVWDSLTWPRPEIAEWWPVPILSWDYFSFKVFCGVAGLALCLSRQPKCTWQILILLAAGLQAWMHRRHTPLFAILAAYWIPEHVNDCVLRFRDWLYRRTQVEPAEVGSIRLHRYALLALTILLGAISVLQLRMLRVEKATFPVSAFEFIARRQLSGRMVTEFNWGQYALYTFWPRILVSVDGRFDTSYSRATLDINLDFMMGNHPRWRNRSPETGPFQADRVLDVGEPNLALVDRQRSHCVATIAARDDWVLLYQDALAQVWGRRDLYARPDSPHYIAPHERLVNDDTQAGWAAYPAVPALARFQTAARQEPTP